MPAATVTADQAKGITIEAINLSELGDWGYPTTTTTNSHRHRFRDYVQTPFVQRHGPLKPDLVLIDGGLAAQRGVYGPVSGAADGLAGGLRAAEFGALLGEEGALLRDWASHSSLERIDRPDNDPPPPLGGNGFGSMPAKGKKRAKGDFRGQLITQHTHRTSSDGEAHLFHNSSGIGTHLSHQRGLKQLQQARTSVTIRL